MIRAAEALGRPLVKAFGLAVDDGPHAARKTGVSSDSPPGRVTTLTVFQHARKPARRG